MHPTASAWYSRRTSTWRDWPVERLIDAKASTRVSVVLPALDEEATVGGVVTGVRGLADRTGLVDEVIVIDSGSQDATAKVAYEAGAIVYHRDDVLAAHGSRPGKGEALWKSLAVATGDVIVFVDADLTDFQPHFVTGLLGPLLTDPEISLVKAFYDRPLLDIAAGGGGRVTELMARPLLGAWFPELAGVVQPLAGEYAGRRALLETLPFAAGYAVETGILLDTVLRGGPRRGRPGRPRHPYPRSPGHRWRSVRCRRRSCGRCWSGSYPDDPPAETLTQFVRRGGAITPVDRPVVSGSRPPMVTIPEYRKSG